MRARASGGGGQPSAGESGGHKDCILRIALPGDTCRETVHAGVAVYSEFIVHLNA